MLEIKRIDLIMDSVNTMEVILNKQHIAELLLGETLRFKDTEIVESRAGGVESEKEVEVFLKLGE